MGPDAIGISEIQCQACFNITAAARLTFCMDEMKMKLIHGNPDAPRSENHPKRMLQTSCPHTLVRIQPDGPRCLRCKVRMDITFYEDGERITIEVKIGEEIEDKKSNA